MKRQSIRKTLLFLSFLFFPVTIYYLSPVISLSGAYYGVISGSLIVFIVLFVISMFTGRGFCAWVCPAGGLQECFSMANGNRPFQIGWKNWIKYVIWVPWFSSIIVLLFLAGGKTQTHFFYQLSTGISILEDFDLIIYFSMPLVMVILAIVFGKRLSTYGKPNEMKIVTCYESAKCEQIIYKFNKNQLIVQIEPDGKTVQYLDLRKTK
ncbi:4Fe-4S binding protein [Neobacillus drentensis]|uniref:4Fe-4S binding protein n=1 Tax=Neobacillus drentensis TaxID=220684 RepID=UPI002FFD7202